MAVLYRNLCYSEVCYNEVELYKFSYIVKRRFGEVNKNKNHAYKSKFR